MSLLLAETGNSALRSEIQTFKESEMTLPYRFSSEDIPILYHYTSSQAACAMVKIRSIWLSEYTAMKDTSEFVYARDRLLDLMRDREVYMDAVPRYCLASTLAGFAENTGLMIGSLTARRDDLSQWRSYSGSGSGCVLGIDARYLEHVAGIAVRTMLYDEQEVHRLLSAGLSVLQQTYEEEPQGSEQLIDSARHLAADLFTIKHPCFADEREVRISRMLTRAAGTRLEDVGGNRSDGGSTPALPVATREGAFGPTRYISLPLVRYDGSSAITSVGLGPVMASLEVEKLRSHFEAAGLEVWHSALPYRS